MQLKQKYSNLLFNKLDSVYDSSLIRKKPQRREGGIWDNGINININHKMKYIYLKNLTYLTYS